MGSISAQVLARKVSDTIRQGKRVKLKDLAIEAGYSKSSASRPQQITRTKSYQVAFALETKDIVDKIDRDIARFQEALASKKLKKEDTKTIVQSLDILIKNRQLLSGGATANVGLSIAISEHVAGKYAKTPQNDGDVKSQNGST